MMFAAGLTALALASAASAPIVGAEQSSPGGVFQFIPNNVTATNGTVITFQFSGAPGNHSVTQSSFADPCTPLAGGFDSGWIFLPSAPTTVPEWNLTVTDDSKPLWFFCKQLLPSPHCSAGMVGAVNAPTTGNNTVTNYIKNAVAFKGPSGQAVGALVGVGASASAPIGPVPTNGQVFGVPSGATSVGGGTASTTGGSSSGASPTTSGSSPGGTTGASPSVTAPANTTSTKSSASSLGASSLSLALAALLGFTFA